MEKINFQNNVTKASAETMTQFQDNIENAINEVLNIVCPIGKVEIFFDNEDHSNYLGFTWERTSIGKTPIGIDSSDSDFNAIGKTGGEKEHTLTTNEMPSHKHEMSLADYGSDACSAVVWKPGDSNGKFAYGGDMIDNAGGSQSHNNLQPYEVMAFWKRVA